MTTKTLTDSKFDYYVRQLKSFAVTDKPLTSLQRGACCRFFMHQTLGINEEAISRDDVLHKLLRLQYQDNVVRADGNKYGATLCCDTTLLLKLLEEMFDGHAMIRVIMPSSEEIELFVQEISAKLQNMS